MSKYTVVTHNGEKYTLNTQGWLNHLHSPASQALLEIYTDEIQLIDGLTVGSYKEIKRNEYQSFGHKHGISGKKYLNKCFKDDFKVEWDDYIALLKQKINDHVIPVLMKTGPSLTYDESYTITKAASNGHVAAMCRLGVMLAQREDDTCLMWLSKAHNRGQLGACYEMSIYLSKKNNVIDSLRCLIVAADRGADIAYMSLFNLPLLKQLSTFEDKASLFDMLEELSTMSYYSVARYFKAVLLLAQEDPSQGIRLLKDFKKNPKNTPSKQNIDETHAKQTSFATDFIDKILKDIAEGLVPLQSVFLHSASSESISYADYEDFARHFYSSVLKRTS